jgi:translation elongation factor EF-Tu-like GTPase
VPAQDDDPPFVLTVEDAFRITGRGTVVIGVIEQDGVLRVGDYLELIQPGDAGTAPLRCRCRGVDLAPG